MRLDRYVSQGTATSRSEVARLVRRGAVTVDGAIARDPALQITGDREVRLYDRPVRPPGHLHVMLHKPAGVVTSTDDGIGPTVMSCIPAELQRRDLAPVGRLDKDTTGLLILTSDGGLNHALCHPRRHVDKVYLADIEGELGSDAEARFAAGVVLGDGSACLPARIERLAAGRVQVTVREGRFHQVKRMIAACGASVVRLHRARIGGLALDPALGPGAARALTSAEIDQLRGGAAGEAE